MIGYCEVGLSEDFLPSLEGRTIKIEKDNSLLTRMEKSVRIPGNFHNKIKFETKEEPYINIGFSTKITPYSAKIKYLLNPEDKYSPYYLFSTGTNLIDGEEIDINEFLGNFRQRLNYGIGIGITIKNIEFEILYGKYNYQIIGVTKQKEDTLYSSNKLTFNCKYRF